MSRPRISAVIFLAPQSKPGSGVNGESNVIFEESSALRLEFDEIGVLATALDTAGRTAAVDFNPVRYPWHVVRKVTGERAAAVEAPRKGRGKLDVALPAEVE